MAFCPICGKRVGKSHRYCALCGAAQPFGEERSGAGTPPYELDYQSDVQNNKVFAVMSYLLIFSLVAYFVAPKNSRFARFHAVQGINLFIIQCIVSAAGDIMRGIFFWIWPLRGIFIASFGIIGLGLLALSIVGIINASKGVTEELPVVGHLKIVKG